MGAVGARGGRAGARAARGWAAAFQRPERAHAQTVASDSEPPHTRLHRSDGEREESRVAAKRKWARKEPQAAVSHDGGEAWEAGSVRSVGLLA